MSVIAREILLKRRPEGMPTLDHFELAEHRLDAPRDGQVLVRNRWMSVDPYMRGRMADRESYIEPFEVGKVMDGAAVGVVEQSADPEFAQGDLISHFAAWRDYALIDARSAIKIDDSEVPAQAYLGAFGFPGLGAYVGLLRIADLREGDTVFVSAASGAVGTVACQIAVNRGCRVIASAGSDEKLDWLKREAGVAAVINYKTSGDLTDALRQACPEGIDVYFDNVGGAHLEAALNVAKDYARFALCGMIAQYNAGQPPPEPRHLFKVVEKRLKLQGFIVSDHLDLMPDFVADMSRWVSESRMKWRETTVIGLENAPQAFLDLFEGKNVGKMLVKVDDQ